MVKTFSKCGFFEVIPKLFMVIWAWLKSGPICCFLFSFLLTGALFLMIVGSLAAFSAAGSTLSLPVLPISIEFYIQPLPVLPRLWMRSILYWKWHLPTDQTNHITNNNTRILLATSKLTLKPFKANWNPLTLIPELDAALFYLALSV